MQSQHETIMAGYGHPAPTLDVLRGQRDAAKTLTRQLLRGVIGRGWNGDLGNKGLSYRGNQVASWPLSENPVARL